MPRGETELPQVTEQGVSITRAPAGRPSDAAQAWRESGGKTGVGRYLDILTRRKRLILLTLSLVLAATAAYSWSMTPLYEGFAHVELQPTSASSAEANQLLSMLVDPNLALQTQVELMQSRAVLRPAAKSLNLEDVSTLEEALSVNLVRGTQIVEIRVRHPDPEKARRWANVVADEYLSFRRGRAREVSLTVSEAIERRIKAAKDGLDLISRQIQENPGAGAQLTAQREALLDQLTGVQAQLLARLTALEAQLSELPSPEELAQGSGIKIESETPQEPVVPNFPLNLALATVLGGLLAVSLALGSEGWRSYRESQGGKKGRTAAVAES